MPAGGDKSRGQDPAKEMRLIELIRENPELYDSDHPHYKDNNQKKIIWEYISEEMNTPVEGLKKMWRKLRCSYLKKSKELQDAEKITESTPRDRALASMANSVMEYAKENSCGNSSGGAADPMPRSSSQLIAISEEERYCAAPENCPWPALSRTSFHADSSKAGKSGSDRVLRPRHSEPPRLALRESLKMVVDAAPRSLTGPPTTPSTRSRDRKLILDPNDSTRLFFDKMAINVALFPQHLQANVKLQICKIVSETECDLPSPMIHNQ